jgi:membrane-bound ClpP family serine protease
MRVDRSQDDTTGLFVLGLAIVMLGLLIHYPWIVALGMVIFVFGMVTRYKHRRNKPPE